MTHKKTNTKYRILPPEYSRVSQGKEALAHSISMQRQRLINEREQRRAESQRSHSDQDPIIALALAAAQTVPAYATELIRKKPKVSMLIGATAVVVVALAVRRIGSKKIMQGVQAASPFVVDYLSEKFLKK